MGFRVAFDTPLQNTKQPSPRRSPCTATWQLTRQQDVDLHAVLVFEYLGTRNLDEWDHAGCSTRKEETKAVSSG